MSGRAGAGNHEGSFAAPTTRVLKLQDTDETGLPPEEPDLDSFSMTESWLDGSVVQGSGAQHVRMAGEPRQDETRKNTRGAQLEMPGNPFLHMHLANGL